jgi:hypothetical protein
VLATHEKDFLDIASGSFSWDSQPKCPPKWPRKIEGVN